MAAPSDRCAPGLGSGYATERAGSPSSDNRGPLPPGHLASMNVRLGDHSRQMSSNRGHVVGKSGAGALKAAVLTASSSLWG